MSSVDPRQFVGVQTWTPDSEQRDEDEGEDDDDDCILRIKIIMCFFFFPERVGTPTLKLDDARAAELAKGRGCLIYTCKSNPSTLIVKGIQSVFDSTDVN